MPTALQRFDCYRVVTVRSEKWEGGGDLKRQKMLGDSIELLQNLPLR
jgi:hypothetical protein